MNRSTSVAYIDLLTCLFVLFVVAFAIVFAQQKINDANKANIEAKAEFMVLIDWSHKSNNDVDVWLKSPEDMLVSFKRKMAPGITLERDDMGLDLTNPHRREIITIREYTPGPYTVNVMLFTKRNEKPEPVKIQILKINPFQIISEREFTFNNEGEEYTALRFWVDQQGRVINKDENYQERLSSPL